ncbi:hypothetical protein ABFT51_14005 [Paenibacillus peoriae]|uniref:hypothetical protein n=1 Tax=Paenibacillus peoriae TaxID=59893 RepID=UPI0032AED0D3
MEKNKIELYQHLKSMAVYLQPNVDETDYELGVDELTKWLTQYNQWFKETVVVNKGYRPYVLYNREVSILGNDIFIVPDKLMELAKSTINNGFAFSITLDIVELFHNYTHLKSLCDDSLLSSVGVTTDNLFVLAKLTSIKDFMRLLINLRRPIGIIGSISTLREYGFLSYESVNSMDITIYPIKSETSNFLEHNSRKSN